jgi:hypothetical protein
MVPSDLPEALRLHRDALAERWLRQFAANRAATGRPVVVVEARLVGALFDEVVSMMSASDQERIPRRHHTGAFAQLAAFPESVALCVDVFQAGSQVIGAFIVENTGPFAAWNTAARNRHLGELDSVFHILVHRELEALCELRPFRAPEGAPTGPNPVAPLNLEDLPGGSFFRN